MLYKSSTAHPPAFKGRPCKTRAEADNMMPYSPVSGLTRSPANDRGVEGEVQSPLSVVLYDVTSRPRVQLQVAQQQLVRIDLGVRQVGNPVQFWGCFLATGHVPSMQRHSAQPKRARKVETSR